MLKLPDKEISYWKNNVSASSYAPLTKDVEVDVVIVGGGITGLTAAYLLKKAGFTVAVLEKNTLGSGTTGGTTGKVTSQHGLIYDELKKLIGEKSARIYAQANNVALERISELVAQEKIDCDWETDDNYVFTTEPKLVSKFKSEAKTAEAFGLPATFVTKVDLSFNIEGAVKFANQAKMHASKYVQGLANQVHGEGSHIFEHSNVIRFQDGQPAIVKTSAATVTAKNVIVATKVPAAPLLARLSYALWEYPHTSYVVAGIPERNVRGMYISPDKEHYSIQTVKYGQKRLLLIGGQKHIPGLGSPTKRHAQLAEYAEKYFGVSSVEYRWKAMDYLVYDSVPLIGKVYPWSKHLYTATGFKKWGLSTSMVAGMILRDLISGEPNSWADTFDSTRFKPVLSMSRAIKMLK